MRDRRHRSLYSEVGVGGARGRVVARWGRACAAGLCAGAVGAQRSPLSWAMSGTQRLAAVAAVSHATHYYNHTQTRNPNTGPDHYNVNIFFVSATLCGVLVAVCAACWRRAPHKQAAPRAPAVYTITMDMPPTHQEELTGPPPAYDAVVQMPSEIKDSDTSLQEVVSDKHPGRCLATAARADSGLPSYEAAVLLRDTKL